MKKATKTALESLTSYLCVNILSYTYKPIRQSRLHVSTLHKFWSWIIVVKLVVTKWLHSENILSPHWPLLNGRLRLSLGSHDVSRCTASSPAIKDTVCSNKLRLWRWIWLSMYFCLQLRRQDGVGDVDWRKSEKFCRCDACYIRAQSVFGGELRATFWIWKWALQVRTGTSKVKMATAPSFLLIT